MITKPELMPDLDGPLPTAEDSRRLVDSERPRTQLKQTYIKQAQAGESASAHPSVDVPSTGRALNLFDRLLPVPERAYARSQCTAAD